MKALIDADILCYALGSLKDDNGLPKAWPLIVSTLNEMVDNILRNSGCGDYTLYLTSSDKTNFRNSVATIRQYKGHRVSEKPYWHEQLRTFLSEDRDAVVVQYMEADDALGIAQDATTVICSLDKDLDMIPGWHYNWQHQDKYYVDEIQALSAFYSQMLTGDPSDNILGLFGVGPKSSLVAAVRGATSELEMFAIVQKAYRERFGSYWEQFLMEHAKLLWIKRKPLEEGEHPADEVTQRLANIMIASIVQD